MTHRKAVCRWCRKEWNISVARDTSHGYVCPICAWRKKERGQPDDSSENNAVHLQDYVYIPDER